MSEAALSDWCSKDETGASKSETEVSSTTQMTASKLLKGILFFICRIHDFEETSRVFNLNQRLSRHEI